ncbi:MAG: cytidylate kinase-like family protein [Flintibacter sp.]|nr:cytidylate kinase-like family protein [Flintibacter sp.]MCI6150235.1 cytidylate kinase-like family protein [Flintibacter sp.]MDD7115965.1 cytidylate kinase-like family protein [Flintibacter sp.]
MGHRVICIGRQFGSGGHEIAVRTAERLGIRVYERELLHLACKYGELSAKLMESSDERATNPYLYQGVYEGNYHVIRGLPTSEVLFALQSHEIKRIAEEEDCVFVGRCADFVLRDSDAQLLRVFVSAPEGQRIRRKMELECLSLSKAKRLVTKMDKQRRKYYEGYTGQVWGDPHNYDLNIDTSVIPISQAVELIVSRF